jgi:hypothetical protein
MLATIVLVLLGFTFVVVRSFRRAEGSGGYNPEGKLRWTEEPPA